MIEKLSGEMKAWAGSHGLRFKGEGLLPPLTTRLRRGLGLGEHRSTLSTTGGERRHIEEGWRETRPERASHNWCEGTLPGGLQGVVAHHVSLSDRGTNRGGDQERYVAAVDTVVFVTLPTVSRASYNLELFKPGDFKAAFSIGENQETSDPLESIVPIPTGRLDLDRFRLTTWPEEPQPRMEEILTPAARQALAELPDQLRVECESGQLCVMLRGFATTERTTLDNLCRLATGLADGMAAVVDGDGPFDPATTLPQRPETTWSRWVDAGVKLVDWPVPPPDVIAAQQAYRPVLSGKGTRTGWGTWGIAAVAIILISLLAAAGWFAGALFWELPMPLAIVGAGLIALGGVRVASREGFKIGKEAMNDKIESSAVPWGLEAFARGYAESSGLTLEDPEELRHRLPVPVPGRAQMAWQGDLGNGVAGHLAIWIDPSVSPAPPQFWIIAGVEGPVMAKPPYRYVNSGGTGVIGLRIDSVARSAAKLDELRRQAVEAVEEGRADSPGTSLPRDGRPAWVED